MPNPPTPDPTPGQVAFEAYWRLVAHVHPTLEAHWQAASPGHRAAWEAAAQAVRPRLTAWERTWLADLGRTAPWTAAEREIWCLLLEKYFGDHPLAKAIYDRIPLPQEDPPCAH